LVEITAFPKVMRSRTSIFGRVVALAPATSLVLLLVAPAVAAQGTNARITLFGSGSFLKADRTFPAEGQTYNSTFAAGGRAGLRVTFDFTDHFSAEGTYSYGTNNLRVSNLSSTPPAVRSFGVRVQQIDGDILYFVSGAQAKLRPFAALGFGIARLSPTSQAKAAATEGFIAGPASLSSGNKFDFNYGFGVERKLDGHFGVRFDLRDHVIEVPRLGAPPGPGAAGAGFYPVSGIANVLDLSVGIVLSFAR
jgi:hypothetical protein